MSSSQIEEAASNQWISVNSKPCPNCKYVSYYYTSLVIIWYYN